MKKILMILLTLALLVGGTAVAFAADLTDEDVLARHEEMLVEKQEWLDELVAEGVITQEEADEYLANMDERFLAGDCPALEGGFGYGIGGGMFQDNDGETTRGFGRGAGCGFRFDD